MSTDKQPQAFYDEHGRALQEVSNAMVTIYKDFFGRGPTKARTSWAGPDTLVVTLENTLVPAERSMVRMGAHQQLRESRLFFQYATVREFCEPVEHFTGRKVRAFVSGIDTAVDGYSVELFSLHPEGYAGPSRIERGEP